MGIHCCDVIPLRWATSLLRTRYIFASNFVFSCSPAFFYEERAALHMKREKIRLLQQRKVSEVQHLKDMPDEIPMPLVIGTRVTGRFCLSGWLSVPSFCL